MWDKTTPARPKPKPTKKPITYGTPPTTETVTRKPTTFKPKPPVRVNEEKGKLTDLIKF